MIITLHNNFSYLYGRQCRLIKIFEMKNEIVNLIKLCTEYLNDTSYSRSRIRAYESLWESGIVQFMQNQSIEVYTPDIGMQFIDKSIAENKHYRQIREELRSVQVLNEFIELGYVRVRRTTPVKYPLEGKIGELMQKHIDNLYALRRSHITINRNIVYMYRFLAYLNNLDIYDVTKIEVQHILDFLSSSGTNNSHVISTLRVMVKFWQEQKIITDNLLYAFEGLKENRKERIPSFYSQQEIGLIEEAVERSSKLGKRDFAIIILASRLGLRAADIAALKFENINWEHSMIVLTQQKTKNRIELPLLGEVGNAIIDYLKNSRHNSTSKNLFLSQRPPYNDITSQMVSKIVGNVIIKSKVDIKDRHHSAHALRHSLASQLLDCDTGITEIAEILGHMSSEVTMKYINISLGQLMKCSLSVPEVNDNFYIQKGGIFYE